MSRLGREPILVTGCTGFIAKHIVQRLATEGYKVRGTLRDPSREHEVRSILRATGIPDDRFEARRCDLTSGDGWDEATRGCRFILHTASPFPSSFPSDKFALVPAARDGTIRVLRAAERAGCERVVLTSSVASIFYGHENVVGRRFTEQDFSNVESPTISAYAVSKTEAEKAAWDCLRDSSTSLVAINPSLVLGPALDTHVGTSLNIIRLMMKGRMPIVPDVGFGIVDVRDVAEAHVRALETPDARGRRLIVSAEPLKLIEIAGILRKRFPSLRRRLPRWRLPTAFVRMAAHYSHKAAMLSAEIGSAKLLDTDPAGDVLQLRPRPAREAVEAAGDSLVRLGLVKA